jgi:hypothetical protein
MNSHTKARFVDRTLYCLVVSGALVFSLSATAQDAEAILNFMRGVGGAVGCSALSDDEGHAVLKASVAAARGLPSETDLGQPYGDGVRVGKAGFCELFKEHPEAVQNLRDAAKRQLSLSAPPSSTTDDAAIDAQKQREELAYLATIPSKVIVPYVPDPKIAEKAAAVQAIWNACNVAMSAGECGLLPWYSFEPFCKVWYHDLGVLIPDGRDFDIAAHHNMRVFWREYPGLAELDQKDQWCARLAHSEELLDVKKRLQELK